MTANAVSEIVELRESGRLAEARALALHLQSEHPEDPAVNLQCAWVHDKMGLESEAVPFYEKAIEAGLDAQDLKSALLGLGSTYRALGHYDLALSTLSRGVEHFPEDRGLQVFHALALYNKGQSKDSCEKLLRLLLDTTADDAIRAYEPALREYSDDLDRTWA